jgi:hypothetical protein
MNELKLKEAYFKIYGCSNILHIGGHRGQEADIYRDLGLMFTFVEPIPTYARMMRAQGFRVIEAAISDRRGEVPFLIGEISERSSLKTPPEGVTGIKDTIIVSVMTLRDVQSGFDGIAIDAQGETYEILKSGDLNFKVILCEVSINPRYNKEVGSEEIIKLLAQNNYKEIAKYQHGSQDIYDLIFIKDDKDEEK